MTKQKTGSNPNQVATVAIYIFLVAALGTYVLPIMSVSLPAFGKKSWSVRDMVSVLPKGMPSKEGAKQEKLTPQYDFLDLVKEITPRDSQTKAAVKVSPEFIAGIWVPAALALAYLLVLVNLFLAALKKGNVFLISSVLSAVCACYALAGTFYLAQVAQRAFSSSLAKVDDSPFGSIVKSVIQQVSIQPEKGLFALSLLTVAVLGVGLYRKSLVAR